MNAIPVMFFFSIFLIAAMAAADLPVVRSGFFMVLRIGHQARLAFDRFSGDAFADVPWSAWRESIRDLADEQDQPVSPYPVQARVFPREDRPRIVRDVLVVNDNLANFSKPVPKPAELHQVLTQLFPPEPSERVVSVQAQPAPVQPQTPAPDAPVVPPPAVARPPIAPDRFVPPWVVPPVPVEPTVPSPIAPLRQPERPAAQAPAVERPLERFVPPSVVPYPTEPVMPPPERVAPLRQPERPMLQQEQESPTTEMESGNGRDVSARLAEVSQFDDDDVVVSNDEILSEDRIPSSLIVFLHVTGGAGATTLAVNTACTLAGPRRNCCLIDLDVQFGGVASLLDLHPGTALQKLMEDPRRLERVALETMLERHSTGMHVLTAPRVPIPLHGLKAAAITDLLRMAKSRFTYVVVDMPVALTTWTDSVLKLAQCTYLVTPLTVQAAHRTARLLHLMKQQDLGQLPLKIVANRHNSAGSGAIGTKQFAKAIGRNVDHLIPNDYEAILHSHNQGVPVVRLSPKAKFSQAMGKMLSEDLNDPSLVQSQRKFAGLDRS